MGSRVSHDSRLEGHLDVATNPAKATWGGGCPCLWQRGEKAAEHPSLHSAGAHLEICVKNPDEGADSGVAG